MDCVGAGMTGYEPGEAYRFTIDSIEERNKMNDPLNIKAVDRRIANSIAQNKVIPESINITGEELACLFMQGLIKEHVMTIASSHGTEKVQFSRYSYRDIELVVE